MDITANPTKRRIIAFRVITALLVAGMLIGGLTALFRLDFQVDKVKHLGYPLYLMSIIGASKILAAVVLSVHGIPLLKVAAYVGAFIVSVCAFVSHAVAGDGIGELINPLVLTAVALAACYLNPNIKFEQDAKHQGCD